MLSVSQLKVVSSWTSLDGSATHAYEALAEDTTRPSGSTLKLLAAASCNISAGMCQPPISVVLLFFLDCPAR